MPDVSTIFATLISAVTGGGLVQWYRTHLKADQQEHTQAMDLVTTLREDMGKVQQRQDKVEQELAQARHAEARLHGQVHLLIERIDTLLDRLEQYEDITQDERRRYTDVPDVSSPA